jgi:hypothetical protein
LRALRALPLAHRARSRAARTRAAGRHPFNCEPPLSKLMATGFLTPAAIHYVRNHGAAPRCDWDTHTITLTGARACSLPRRCPARGAAGLPALQARLCCCTRDL